MTVFTGIKFVFSSQSTCQSAKVVWMYLDRKTHTVSVKLY